MASMQRYIDKAKKDLGDFNVPDRTPSSKTEKDSRIKMLKDAESGEYKVGKKKVSKGRIVEMKKGGKVSPPKKRGDIGHKVFLSKVAKQMKDTGQPFGGKTKKKAEGGSLKAVPSENTGLGKLPTPVRNKMGFMKKGGIVKMKGGGITSNINARSKKSKAELAAIANKKPILDANKAHDQAFKDMDADIANKKKEKLDFSKMKKNDFSKMTTEQLLELHRRQRDLGNTSATKNYKKGGIVKMKGGGAATRGMNFNRGY